MLRARAFRKLVQPSGNSATVLPQSREDSKTRKQTDLCVFVSLRLRVEKLHGYLRRVVLAYPIALAMLVALGVGVAVIFGAGPAASAAQETRIILVPPSQARTGELVTVRLLAQNAHNLAGFQATVLFDPA